MFCPSCGKKMPEDTNNCPDCNKPEQVDSKEDKNIAENIEAEPKLVEATADSNSTDSNSTESNSTDSNSTDSNSTDSNSTESTSTSEASTEQEKVQKPKSDIDTDVGAYLKGFFKDPFEAVLNRSTPKYWLWGLIALGAYVLLVFFGQLAASTGAGFAFASMFCLACGLAAMIFGLFLFQGPFQLEKKSLNEIVAAVGLSMTPMFILYFIGSIFDAAAFSYLNIWQSVLNLRLFTPPFVSIGYIFSAFILGRFYSGDDVAKMKRSFLLVLVAFAVFFLIESLFMYVAIRVG